MADAGSFMYSKDVEKIKQNFQEVLSELDSIARGSQKEREMFERLRRLVDVERIERLSQMLDSMEKQARESEERAIEAFRDMERYRKELEMEQERLEKLWDAYKKQEDDMGEVEESVQEWRTRFSQQQETIAELRKKVETMKDLEEDREKVDKLREHLKKVREENENLQRELERHKAVKENLEKEVENLSTYIPYKKEVEELRKKVAELEPLRDYVKYKKKADEMEALYKKEQERLAKLYKVYEDLSAQLQQAEAKLERWEEWFSSNREYVEKAAYAFSKFREPEDLL
ncbi:MAG: hypothetical protein ACP5EK_02690 [Thermoplasmatota archaeon]